MPVISCFNVFNTAMFLVNVNLDTFAYLICLHYDVSTLYFDFFQNYSKRLSRIITRLQNKSSAEYNIPDF